MYVLTTYIIEMEKLFLGLASLIVSSASFADCFITYSANDSLTKLIAEKGFNFDGYDKLCKRLNANDAGVAFKTVTQISPYQTTAGVVLSMYPKGNKYKGVTFESVNWLSYTQERTTTAQNQELYSLTMYALQDLANTVNEDKLKRMLIEVNEIRKATK